MRELITGSDEVEEPIAEPVTPAPDVDMLAQDEQDDDAMDTDNAVAKSADMTVLPQPTSKPHPTGLRVYNPEELEGMTKRELIADITLLEGMSMSMLQGKAMLM